MTTALPTITQLIEFLELPDREKTKGSFADEFNEEARCCLGHYCHLAGLTVPADQAIFNRTVAVEPTRVGVGGLGGWALPDNHWLFTIVDDDGEPGDVGFDLQDVLANANDMADDFGPVIAILRNFATKTDLVTA